MMTNAMRRPDLSPLFPKGGKRLSLQHRMYLFLAFWILALIVVAITFVPGIGLALGKLPGDLLIGPGDHAVYLPLATSSLVTIAIGGLFYLASNYLTRR